MKCGPALRFEALCGTLPYDLVEDRMARKIINENGKSGLGWRTPEYASWNGLTQRCLNPKDPKYPSYGGRGITVCQEWIDSFKRFLEDVGPRPSPDYSIDRIDNNGNYCKENCRWATRSQQQLNRRNNHRLSFNGETLTIAEWARKLGVPKERIASRLRYGWTTERTLSAPSATVQTGPVEVAIVP